MSMPPWIAKQVNASKTNPHPIADKQVVAPSPVSPGRDTMPAAEPSKASAPDGFVAIGSQTMTFREIEALRQKYQEDAAEKPSKLQFFRNIFKRK